MTRSGWYNESKRHSLARQGIKTGRKITPVALDTRHNLAYEIVKFSKGFKIWNTTVDDWMQDSEKELPDFESVVDWFVEAETKRLEPFVMEDVKFEDFVKDPETGFEISRGKKTGKWLVVTYKLADRGYTQDTKKFDTEQEARDYAATVRVSEKTKKAVEATVRKNLKDWKPVNIEDFGLIKFEITPEGIKKKGARLFTEKGEEVDIERKEE
jgi:hypothetical protein